MKQTSWGAQCPKVQNLEVQPSVTLKLIFSPLWCFHIYYRISWAPNYNKNRSSSPSSVPSFFFFFSWWGYSRLFDEISTFIHNSNGSRSVTGVNFFRNDLIFLAVVFISPLFPFLGLNILLIITLYSHFLEFWVHVRILSVLLPTIGNPPFPKEQEVKFGTDAIAPSASWPDKYLQIK